MKYLRDFIRGRKFYLGLKILWERKEVVNGNDFINLFLIILFFWMLIVFIMIFVGFESLISKSVYVFYVNGE